MQEKLYVVIPAYNEEMNIEIVAREWHEVVESCSAQSRLVIIDDGSKDGTYARLCALEKELPQLVALTKPNGGHGATVLYGYYYALEAGADYIFQTDSDGQTLPSEFTAFWEKRGEYDAIIGNRVSREDGFSRVMVTKVLKLVLFCIFGIAITDANTPYRLMNRRVMEKYVPRIPKDFNLSNVMLSVLLLHGKEKVLYLPITFRPRQGGVNSINLKRICRIGARAVVDFSHIRREMKKE